MHIKKLLSIFTFSVIIAGFQSCERYEILPEEIPQEVTFSDIQQIFANKCIGCHDGVTANPILTAGNAYNNLFAASLIDTTTPEASGLYIQMNDSSHSYYSTKADRDKVLAWIKAGALNN
jgi:hypothetical protein